MSQVKNLTNLNYKLLYEHNFSKDFIRVEITDGKYKGLVYHYIKVSVQEDKDSNGTLQFSYDIDVTPENIDTDKLNEEDKKAFEGQLGDILVHIIESKEQDASREANTIQSTT